MVGSRSCDDGSREWNEVRMGPRAQECRQPLEAGKESISPGGPRRNSRRRNWWCLSHMFVGLCHSSRRTLAEEYTGGKPFPALMEPVFWLFLQQQLFSQYIHTDTQ